MMDERQKRLYWQLYVDVWKLLKLFLDTNLSERQVERAVAISKNLYDKYTDTDNMEQLAMRMILDTLDEIGRISARENKKNSLERAAREDVGQ